MLIKQRIEKLLFPCAGKIEAAVIDHHAAALDTLDAVRRSGDILAAACTTACKPLTHA